MIAVAVRSTERSGTQITQPCRGRREVGSADDRAEIVGIFNLIKKHEGRILSFFRRPGKEVIHLRVLESSSLGDGALMPAGLGKLVKERWRVRKRTGVWWSFAGRSTVCMALLPDLLAKRVFRWSLPAR